MARVRAARVRNTEPRIVQNVESVETLALLQIDGQQYIFEVDWKSGQTPAAGMVWDGQRPASFAPAPVAPPEDMPDTMPEAWQAWQDAEAVAARAKANFAIVSGLPSPGQS